MKSLADGLSSEIAKQIDPSWRKNEEAYWAVRDQLLSQYLGRWIGFADGGVIVSATTPLEVFLATQQRVGRPFIVRVGHESEPWYRIRRVAFKWSGVSVPGSSGLHGARKDLGPGCPQLPRCAVPWSSW